MRRIRCGRRGFALAVAAAALAAGGSLLGVGVAAQKSAPQPPAATAQAPVVVDPTTPTPDDKRPAGSATMSAPPPPPPSAQDAAAGQPPVVPRSAPASLAIPAIGVHTSFVQLGLNPDGTIQVPPDVTHVGWYRLGPAPGQVGPAVVLGHVDSAAAGPGVFFRLGALAPGDPVRITLGDGHVVTFNVYAVREYPKDAFPTQTVYGNTTDPQLRLITCGGSFDHATGHYRSNIVVYAREIA